MRIAIGDIHGCQRALQTMLDVVRPSTDDLVVTLGDYVDRGPDSKAVIDTLLELQKSHNLVHLMGNHEIQMIRAMEASHHRDRFLSGLCGGMDTLNSYGGNFDDIPEDHWVFIKSAGLYHELEDCILVHAGLEANLPIDEQDRETYYYQRFHCQKAHISGKTIVCGHSIQGDLPTNSATPSASIPAPTVAAGSLRWILIPGNCGKPTNVVKRENCTLVICS